MWERRARRHTTAIPTVAMPPIARRTQGRPLPSGPYLPSVRVLVPREAGLPSRAILIADTETPRTKPTVHTWPPKRGGIGIRKDGQRGRHGVIRSRDQLEPKWLRNNAQTMVMRQPLLDRADQTVRSARTARTHILICFLYRFSHKTKQEQVRDPRRSRESPESSQRAPQSHTHPQRTREYETATGRVGTRCRPEPRQPNTALKHE
jgi:hypothetical protein